MSVYHNEAFAERVNFAANYIRNGRPTSRTFDTCFEMHDGDAVIAALIRKGRADPAGKLAANLFKYIGRTKAEETERGLAHIETRDLKHEAARMRQTAKVEFAKWLDEHQNSAA